MYYFPVHNSSVQRISENVGQNCFLYIKQIPTKLNQITLQESQPK